MTLISKIDIIILERMIAGMKKRYKKMVLKIFSESAVAALSWGDFEKLLSKGL